MRPACARTLLLGGLILAALMPPSAHAQESGFTEAFVDPGLAGWELGGDATVADGALLLSDGGFAIHPSAIGTGMLHLALSISGDGVVEIHYRASNAGAYVVLLTRGGLELVRRGGEDGVLLGRAAMDLPIDSFFPLTIDIAADHHAVLLGDEESMWADAPEPLPPGGVLLRAGDGATARFDSVAFEPAGAPDEPTRAGAEQPPSATEPTETPPDDLSWVFTGGPPGGLGYDIRMDPRDPDVMYVTDAFAGAFKSLDGGSSWFPINDGIATRAGTSGSAIPVFSLSIDPNDPDRLWAGTQFASEVYRSDDGGGTWTLLDTGIEEVMLSIRGLTVQPGDSDVVYFAAEVSSHEWNREQPVDCFGLDATKGVLYRSDDAGGSWRRIWEGDNLARYVWIHPDDPDVIYVSTGIFDRCAANADPAADERGGVGILRSRDRGATWEELGVGHGVPADELYFGSLFMHPTDPSTLMAASGNGVFPFSEESSQGGIYLTEDGGDNWREVLDGHAFSGVEICEGDPEVVYAGALSGFFRSDDGGETWVETAGALWGSPGIVAGFPIDLQCDPRDPMRVFVNNYNGGNFLSEDGGATWIDASRGYTGALMAQIALAADDPAVLYASSRGGFFATDDGGNTWRGLGTGIARTLEGVAIAVDPSDPRHVIGTLIDAGPYPKVSRDGGSTWYGVEPEMLDPVNGETLAKIVFGPRTEGLVLASVAPGCVLARDCPPGAGGGIVRSDDGGDTFEETSLTDGIPYALAPYPGDDSLWYAAVHPDGLYASQDSGRSWQPIPADGLPTGATGPGGIPAPIVVSLAVDPVDPDRLYAGFTRSGVGFSEDGGSTWAFAAAGLPPEITVVDIAIDSTEPSVIYIATPESGVFRSYDRGATWSALSTGLLSRTVTDLALSADGGTLYASTVGAGVFRLDVTGEPPLPAPPVTTSTPHDERGGTAIPWTPIAIATAGAAALLALAIAVWRRRG